MGILRSETMKHGTLVLPAERARQFVDILGKRVQIQIEDMNAYSMKRNYRKYIQRYDLYSVNALYTSQNRRY
jgi:V-type H+-transporting ATPase subunit a